MADSPILTAEALYREAAAELAALRAHNAQLVAALEFYGNEQHWRYHCTVHREGGPARAQAALSASPTAGLEAIRKVMKMLKAGAGEHSEFGAACLEAYDALAQTFGAP